MNYLPILISALLMRGLQGENGAEPVYIFCKVFEECRQSGDGDETLIHKWNPSSSACVLACEGHKYRVLPPPHPFALSGLVSPSLFTEAAISCVQTEFWQAAIRLWQDLESWTCESTRLSYICDVDMRSWYDVDSSYLVKISKEILEASNIRFLSLDVVKWI